MQAAVLVLSFATTIASTLPASPLVWLRPAELPFPGSLVKLWPNAVTDSDVVGATLDSTYCCLGSELCSSAPFVGVLSSGDRVVNFTGPGLFGLGNNLIVAGDYSAPNTSYSVFFASSTVPGIAGQRILGECGITWGRDEHPPWPCAPRFAASRDVNWLIGSWWSPIDNATFVDRACELCATERGFVLFAARYVRRTRRVCIDHLVHFLPAADTIDLGDAGWLDNSTVLADGAARLYGLTVSAQNTGCLWHGAQLLACGIAFGPNVLRLGGGYKSDPAYPPQEFGTGAIIELVVWDRELNDAEVLAVAHHFDEAYPGVLV